MIKTALKILSQVIKLTNFSVLLINFFCFDASLVIDSAGLCRELRCLDFKQLLTITDELQ